jgi:hypothetical protein
MPEPKNRPPPRDADRATPEEVQRLCDEFAARAARTGVWRDGSLSAFAASCKNKKTP